jgi:hypothetical protein
VPTRKRNDSHGTEFGLWLREQESIDSSLGYAATNVDYLWSNYKTGDWMLIEEKRYGADVSWCQKKLLKLLHLACKQAAHYHGVHLLVFEHTSPEDGRIWLDRREITKEELLAFLRFQKTTPA